MELEKEALLRDLNVQVYNRHPKEEENHQIKSFFKISFYELIKKKVKDEEILVENYDYKGMAKNGALVLAKLRLNC